MRVLLATTLALLPLAASANNTSKRVEFRVTTNDGRVREGRIKLTKTKLQVRAKKIPYDEVTSLRGVFPPPDAVLAERREAYEARAGKLAGDDAKGWAKLGTWARGQDLEPEAKAAFERALTIDASLKEARSGLGHVQSDGAWVRPADYFTKRRAAAGRDGVALFALAREALDAGARAEAFLLLHHTLMVDPWNAKALKLMRPLTDRYRQKVRLSFPLRGRWKASEDPTRHHQKKAFASYALDLIKVDADGWYKLGSGKQHKDHYAWDQPFYAAAPGRVVKVQDGFPDLPTGTLGNPNESNLVGIDHGNDETTWYVHARKGTITVKEGDQVERGQLLGKIGNSGKAGIPHLHFTLSFNWSTSVPWACDDYVLVAPDHTKLLVERACPHEGWTIEATDPK